MPRAMADFKNSGAWLAVFRILTGAIWLDHAYGKFMDPQWAAPNGTCFQILTGMSNGTSGIYHDFVTGVALPHIGLFANLVLWGETLTGVSLVLGLLSRLGGLVGFLLALQYFTAKGGYAHLDAYAGFEMTTAILTVINFALPTGTVFGFDALFGRRKGGRSPG